MNLIAICRAVLAVLSGIFVVTNFLGCAGAGQTGTRCMCSLLCISYSHNHRYQRLIIILFVSDIERFSIPFVFGRREYGYRLHDFVRVFGQDYLAGTGFGC